VTTISLSKAAAHKTRADALVVGVVKDGTEVSVAPGAEQVAAAFGRSFAATCKSLGVKGSVGEVTKLPGNGAVKAPLVVLAGLGDSGDITPESIRRAVGSAVRSLSKVETVALAVPADTSARACAVAEGVLLGGYAFTRYLSDDDAKAPTHAVVLTPLARNKGVQADVHDAEAVSRAVNTARDLVNTPASDLNPVTFAEQVVERAKGSKVKVSVMDETDLENGGYGGIMAVGKGSATPPRLVTLSYKPRGAKAHIALVGKGITFDSGGLSIKIGRAHV